METIGTYLNVGQTVYRVKDEKGNSDIICIAVSDGIAELIANKFNGNGPVVLGGIPDEKLHSNK
jgi:hypothetical protein